MFLIPSSPSGPDGSNVETISLATPDIPGEPLASNLFGAAVTTGLFDSDTLRDLAIGIPQRRTRVSNAGTVLIRYASGATAFLSETTDGIQGSPEANDRFGWSLGSANWGNGGGRTSPSECHSRTSRAP